MKKTLNIHILGTQFTIEEDAYNQLDHFLNQLKLFIEKSKSTERSEDTEVFLVDFFHREQELGAGTIITLDIVDKAIGAAPKSVGFTNWYADNSTVPLNNSEKVFTRCVDDKIIGGVCSGIAKYLGIDKTLIRIFFLLLGIGGLFVNTIGIPIFLLYIILLIIIPKGYANDGPSVQSRKRSKQSDPEETINNQEPFAPRKTKKSNDVGRKVFGGILFALSLAGLLGIVMVVHIMFGALPSFLGDLGAPPEIVEMISLKAPVSFLTIFILGIVGLPVLLLLYASCRLLFNYTTTGRPVFFSVFLIWIILVLLPKNHNYFNFLDIVKDNGIVTYSISDDFDTFESEILNYSKEDTIVLMMNGSQFGGNLPKYASDGLQTIVVNGEVNYIGLAQFTIVESSDDVVRVLLTEDSKDDVEDIYEYLSTDHQLILDKYFFVENQNRRFHMKSVLEIPQDQVVFIDESLLPLIDNIQNAENVWDGDMIGKYWKMTSMGLTEVDRD